MKKLTIIIVLIIVFTIGVLSLLARSSNVIAGQPSMSDETPPASPDPNRELKPYIAPTTPPLPVPLTENQALEQAVYFDTVGGVVWVEPWSSETIIDNPERIQIHLYSSRAEAAKARGQDIWYSADLEADAGQVWVVTIQGTADVSLAMPHMEEGTLVEGVTYQISARTGVLLGMSTGPFIKQQ